MSVNANSNQRPVIDTAIPSNQMVSFQETETMAFTVTASDPEGSNVVYRWALDGVTVGDNSANYTMQTDWGDIGRYELRCYVSDGFWQEVVCKQWNITVENIPMQMLTTSLPAGVERGRYYAQLQCDFGVGPYTWSVETPEVITWRQLSDANVYVDPEELTDVVSVDTGYGFHMALREDETVIPWGRQLLSVYYENTLTNVVSIAADCWLNMVIYSDRTVGGWGKFSGGLSLVNSPRFPLWLTNIVEVAGNGDHFLGLKADGTLVAWNDYGDHRTCSYSIPPNGGRYTDIAACGWHFVALVDDGTVVSWGENTNLEGLSPGPPESLHDVVAISTGLGYGLALKRDGTVVAWGLFRSDWGGSKRSEIYVPDGLTDVVSISAGAYLATALKADGSVVCWGAEDRMKLDGEMPANLPPLKSLAVGYSFVGITDDSVRLPKGLTLSPGGLITGRPLQAVTNDVVFVARDANGDKVRKSFTLDVASNVNERPSFDAQPMEGRVSINIGDSHEFVVLATDPEGSSLSYRWFLDDVEQVATGSRFTFNQDLTKLGRYRLSCIISDEFWIDETTVEWIIDVEPARPVIKTLTLPSGKMKEGYHAALAATNGLPPYTYFSGLNVRTWGAGSSSASSMPLTVGNAVKICTGYGDYISLSGAGHVQYWGSMSWDVEPEDFSAVLDFDCGWYDYDVVVRRDGTVTAWGENRYGQCNVPTNLSDVVDVEAGWAHTLALRQDGTVISWGDMELVPSGLSNVVAVSAGYNHDLVVLDDGSVQAWGDNSSGACDVPESLNNVMDVAAGSGFSLVLRTDGTVVAWGSNDYGQCDVPEGLTNVISIACGRSHCLALQRDGILVGWGYSFNGQLSFPVDLGPVAAMDAGYRSSVVLSDNGDALPVGLSISLDGVISGEPQEPHSGFVYFHVKDANNQIGEKKLWLEIESQLPPVVDAMNPFGPSTVMGESLNQEFSVTAHDPEGDPLDYQWIFDGADVGTNGNAYALQSDWGDVGPHILRCTVSDAFYSTNTEWIVSILWDNDFDGSPNDEERRAGTDPMDADSIFGIRNFGEGSNGQRTISFHSGAGHAYQVYYSDDLTVGWQPLGDPIVATGPITEWEAEVPPGTVSRFYRIIALEPATP